MRNFIPFLAAALLVMPTWVAAEAQTQSLESVLMDAAASGKTDFVKSLLDSGANIESKNAVGATPLIFASVKGQKDVVKLLLDRGADVNAKTATGITPLIAAASAGDADIVKLLLAKGADVSVKEQQGRTALDMAIATGDQTVMALLRSVDKTSGAVSPPVPKALAPASAPVTQPTSPAPMTMIPQAKPLAQLHTDTVRQADSQSGLTVRLEPSPNGNIVAYLPVGSRVTYSGTANNGWVQLSAPTGGGWVAESYLGSRSPEASVIGVDNPEQCLRVRSGPGTNNEKIGCLPKGAILKLSGTVQNNWAQIVEPIAGWVTARQIQAPGLFPAKAATSGVQKERRGTREGTGYRRQNSENEFTQADKESDREMSEFRRENANVGSFQPGGFQPGRLFPVGPLGIGRFPF